MADVDDSHAEELEDVFEDLTGIAPAVIVTNVDTSVFVDQKQKDKFHKLFTLGDDNARFEYFKSFRRVRIHYSKPDTAVRARIQNHQITFGDNIIRCFLAQAKDEDIATLDDAHLRLPDLEKQFLISPPASPPVGWEQAPESAPVVNQDLLLLKLQHVEHDQDTEEARQLVSATDCAPEINLIPCGRDPHAPNTRIKFIHTPRPSLADD